MLARTRIKDRFAFNGGGDIHFYRGSFTSREASRLQVGFRHKNATGDKGCFAYPTPGKNTVNECSTFLPRIVVIRVWIFENAATPWSIYGNIRAILERKETRLCKLSVCAHRLMYDVICELRLLI